jgi:hypothetical protein
MTEPNYLTNHFYVLRGDLKQIRRHVVQLADDLMFVTGHRVMRNLRTMARAARAEAYSWKNPGPSLERIALVAFLSAGVIAGLALARPAPATPARLPILNRRPKEPCDGRRCRDPR